MRERDQEVIRKKVDPGLEARLNQYHDTCWRENKKFSISDIYEQDREFQSGRSLAIKSGFSVGPAALMELVRKIESYASNCVEIDEIQNASEALDVLDTKEKQTRAEWPNDREIEANIAEFVRSRVEKFYQELDERAKIAGVEIDDQTRRNFLMPLDKMHKFYEGEEADFIEDYGHFAGIPKKEERKKLYDFLQKYPVGFMEYIIYAIRSKRLSSNQAFNPMISLECLEKWNEKWKKLESKK